MELSSETSKGAPVLVFERSSCNLSLREDFLTFSLCFVTLPVIASHDDEEGHGGVLCVAAPIINKEHLPFAVLSISLPKVRAKEKALKSMVREVPKLALQLSLDLGVTDIRKCFGT
jgi:hypothetical protein